MNPEIITIISSILDEHRAELEALFDDKHLLAEESIMSKWDHGFSEGRVSGFRFQRDGYDCHLQIILNAEVNRSDRPISGGTWTAPDWKRLSDKLLVALKGLIENEDDVPGLYCPFREHWDKALEAIHEADPYWEHQD